MKKIAYKTSFPNFKGKTILQNFMKSSPIGANPYKPLLASKQLSKD